MDCVADTSVLLRLLSPDDPLHPVAARAIHHAIDAGDRVCFTPQCVREAWAVITRPRAQNGFGLTPTEAEELMEDLFELLTFVDDVPGTFARWRDLVRDHAVSGRQAHDANHVATMKAHGISRIMTLDRRDFARYPDIEVMVPSTSG